MQLTRAFEIRPKEVVSFVGGGGKTTAMFRLADELVDRGKRVVTTTTTRIFAAQIKLAPFHIRASGDQTALDELRIALRDHTHVLVVGATSEDGKAFGVDPGLVDRIIALDEVDAVIVEADGARMRPFKAPGDHEPVIPASTTLLVPVVGIDAVGAPLDDEHVHRAGRVAELAGVSIGTIIEPELIARVIANDLGGLKNRPAGARVIPLVNKTQNVAQMLIARDLAGQLLQADSIEAVAISVVKNPSLPVAEVHRRVAAIVLAAGGSTRMRGPIKQLLPWGDSTLVRHTVDVVSRSQVSEICVVVGNQAENVIKDLGSESPSTVRRIVDNPDWEQGRSTSVRAGLMDIRPEIAAALFVNADQPFLTANAVDTILDRYFQTLSPIVIPVYEGTDGSPALFGRELFGELLQLTGDEGGRRLLTTHKDQVERVTVVNALAATDVDTLEQYHEALALAKANPAEGIASTVPHRE